MAGGPRDTIRARIALDGAEEIKQELFELGVVGETAFRKIQNEASKLKGPDASLATSLRTAQVAMDNLAQSFQRAGRILGGIGALFSVGLTVPIAAFGKATLEAAGGFEKGLNQLQASSGATGQEMDQLKQKALELSKAFSIDPTEIVNSMKAMVVGGLEVEQVLAGATEAAIKLAKANAGSVESAGQVISDLTRQFKLDASSFPQLVNDITGALNASKGSFDQFALALGQSGAETRRAGLDLQSYLALLATSAPAFNAGSDAGTSFKVFMQRLTPTTKEAADIQKELNLQFRQFPGGPLKDAAGIVQELTRAFAGLDTETRNRKLTEFFGTDSVRTAAQLMEEGLKGLQRVQDKMKSTSAGDQVATQMRGWVAGVEAFNAALARLQIAIGDSGLLDFATGIINKITEWVEAMTKWSPSALNMVVVIGALAAAFGPLLVALGAVAFQIATLARVSSGVTGILAKLSEAGASTGKVAGAIEAGASAVSAVADVASASVTKLGTTSQKAAAETTKGFAEAKKAGHELLVSMASGLAGIAPAAASAGTKTGKAIEDGINPALKKVAASAKQVGPEIAAGLASGLADLPRLNSGLVARMTQDFEKLPQAMKPVVADVVESLGAIPVVLNQKMAAAAKDIPDALKPIPAAFNKLKPELVASMSATAAAVGAELVPVRRDLERIPVTMRTAWKQAAADVGAELAPIISQLKNLPAQSDEAWKLAAAKARAGVGGVATEVRHLPAELKANMAEVAAQFGAALIPIRANLKAIPKETQAAWTEAARVSRSGLAEIGANTTREVSLLAKTWGELKFGVRGAVDAILALSPVIGALPWGKIVIGAALAVGAIAEVVAHWDDLKQGFAAGFDADGVFQQQEGFWKNLGGTIRLVTQDIIDFWDEFRRGSRSVGDQMAEDFRRAVNFVVDPKSFDHINEALAEAIKAWPGILVKGWDEAEKILRTRIDSLDLSKNVADKFRAVPDLLAQTWENFLSTFESKTARATAAAMGFIQNFATDSLTALRAVNDALDKIQNGKAASLPFGETGSDARVQANVIETAFRQAALDAEREMRVATARMRADISSVAPAAVAAAAKINDAFVKVWSGQSNETKEFAVQSQAALDKIDFSSLVTNGENTVRVWRALSNAQRQQVEEFAQQGKTEAEILDRRKQKIKELQGGITDYAVKTAEAMQQASGAVQRHVTITNEFGQEIQNTLELAGSNWKKVPQAAQEAAAAVGQPARQIAETVKTSLLDAVAGVPEAWRKAGTEAGAGLQGTIAQFKPFEALLPQAKTAGTDAAKAVTDPLKNAGQQVGDAVGRTAQAAAKAATEPVKTEAEKTADQIKKALTEGFTEIKTFIAATVQAMVSELDKLIAKASEVKSALSSLTGTAAPAAAEGQPAATPGQPDAASAAAGGPFAALVTQATEAVTQIKAIFTAARDEIPLLFTGMVVDWSSVQGGALSAATEIKAQFLAAKGDVLATMTQLTEAVRLILATNLVPPELRTQILAPFAQAEGEINAIFERIVQAITAQMQQATGAVNTEADAMVVAFQRIEAAARAAADAAGSIGHGGGANSNPLEGGGTVEAATGGHIRGPGSSKSDSIPAWLSNGEFVLQARAVKKYGLGLLHALNRGRLKLPSLNQGGPAKAPRITLGLPAFAAGGFAAPRFKQSWQSFANGGLARLIDVPAAPMVAAPGEFTQAAPRALHPVSLTIGAETVQVQATTHAVEDMVRAAQRTRIVKAGRGPSWYGG